MLKIYPEKCLHCGGCVPVCPADALLLTAVTIICNHELCQSCGDCALFCPVNALELDIQYVEPVL
ncbi:MAG: DUF362 domain-containing protein [Candidatus Zixiibacteriota bacterium]